MSLFTVPMRLLTAVVLEQNSSLVVQELLKLGAMDFIHVETLAPEMAAQLAKRTSTLESAKLGELRTRIEALYRQAGFPPPGSKQLDLNNLHELDVHQISNKLDTLYDDLQRLRDRQKNLSQSMLSYNELLQYARDGKMQYLDIRVGRTEGGQIETLKSRLTSYAHVLIERSNGAIVLTLRRDGSQITPLFDKFGWIESVKVSQQRLALKDLISEMEQITAKLRKESDQIKVDLSNRIKLDESVLEDMWCNIRMHELIGQVESNFSQTRNTVIFSGWVPKHMSSRLEEVIRTACAGQCVIEWIDSSQMPRQEVPVAVQQIPVLSPFQKMVDNYHIPEYGTINPTIFVTITYLAMFGLMFGDAGQGLVIMLIGLFKLWKYKKNGEASAQGKMISVNLSRLFVFLGAASIITGILFGSYFGYPLIKPLWFDYHGAIMGSHDSQVVARDVYWVLGVTIKFGIIVISLGLILNWINLARKKDWMRLFLDKNGIVGGWIFAVGTYGAFSFVKSGYKSFPEGLFFPIAIAVPVCALLLKVPLYHVLQRKNHAGERKTIGALIMDSVMEWVVDVLEIFSGFLANTLSFMRVAGLGIAHVSLMVAFMNMAELAGGGIFGVLIMIVGNALVIALEGLSAGIQSLRLNYYEFFSKYYTGKGFAYHPVALHP